MVCEVAEHLHEEQTVARKRTNDGIDVLEESEEAGEQIKQQQKQICRWGNLIWDREVEVICLECGFEEVAI